MSCNGLPLLLLGEIGESRSKEKEENDNDAGIRLRGVGPENRRAIFTEVFIGTVAEVVVFSTLFTVGQDFIGFCNGLCIS